MLPKVKIKTIGLNLNVLSIKLTILKKHAKELFYNNLENILLENSLNNKRDYWRVIIHFVKNNNSKSCIPSMCSPVDIKYSYTDRDIAETLNFF